MRFSVLVLIICGCAAPSIPQGAFTAHVGSTTRPAVEALVAPGAIQVGPTSQPAITLVIEPGGVTVHAPVTAPPIPEGATGALNKGILIVAVAIAFWIIPNPKSILQWIANQLQFKEEEG